MALTCSSSTPKKGLARQPGLLTGTRILYVSGHEATVSAQDILVMDRDGSDPRIVAHFTDCCRWYPAQQPTH